MEARRRSARPTTISVTPTIATSQSGIPVNGRLPRPKDWVPAGTPLASSRPELDLTGGFGEDTFGCSLVQRICKEEGAASRPPPRNELSTCG